MAEIKILNNEIVSVETGKLGIGTSSPDLKLHLAHSDSNNGLLLEHTSQASGFQVLQNIRETEGLIWQRWANGVFASNLMTLTYSGELGIGTTNPTYKLHVDDNNAYGGILIEGDNAPGLSIRDNSGTSLSKIYVQSTSSSQGNLRISSDDNNTATTPTIEFIIGGSDKMRIVDNGNVGIGTTNPTAKLTVEGDDADIFLRSNDYTIARLINRGSTGVDLDTGLFSLFTSDGTTNNVEKIRLDAGGYSWINSSNVGIGTTTPADMLDVTDGNAKMVFGAASSDRPLLYFQHNAVPVDGEEVGLLDFRGYNDASQDTRYVILTAKAEDVTDGTEDGSLTFQTMTNGTATQTLTMRSSNVGIGSTAPAAKLNVASTGANAYSATITKGTNMKGIINALSNNADDMVGIYFGTGTTSEGTHWSGITGSRSQNATDWSTQLNFYTHNEDVANLNDATQKMVIKGNGNVGIGTTNPETSRLLVRGSTSDSTSSIIQASSSAGATRFIVRADGQTIFYGSDNGEKVRITETGNVGIGETAPLVKLQIEGDAMPGTTDPASVQDMLTLYRFGSPTVWSGGATLALGRYTTGNSSNPSSRLDFKLKDAGGSNTALPETTVMTMQSNGNVGIGKTDPSAPLHINGGSTNQVVKIQATTAPYVRFKEGGTDVGFIQFGTDTYISNQKAGTLNFRTNNTDKMTILSDGNVGIGTTSPKAHLHINDGGTYNNTDANNRLFIERDDHAYILMSTPDDKDQGIHFRNTTDNANVGRIAYQHRSTGDSLRFRVGSSSNNNEFLIINSDGSLDFKGYGAGGIKGDATYVLGVDSSGNVVETTTAGVYFGTNTSNGTYTNQWQRVLVIDTGNFDSQGFRLRIEGTGNTSGQSIVAEIEFNYKNQNGAIRARTTVNSYGTSPVDKDDVAIYFDTTNLEATFYFKVKENYTTPIYSIVSGRIRNYAFYSNVIGDDTALASETNDSITSNLKFQGIVQDQDSGLVGVGTSAPGANLDVYGSVRATAGTSNGLRVHTNSGITASNNYMNFFTSQSNGWAFNANGTGADNTTKVVITAGGNVGIGTTSPDYKLQVATPAVQSGSDYAWSFDLTRADSTSRGFSIGQGSGGGTVAMGGHNTDIAIGHTFGTDSNGNPAFYETMRIQHVDQAVGNVGIGTATPNAKLDVQGGDILAGGNINIDNRGDFVTFYGDNSSNHSITSRDTAGNANDDIRINSYGNVLINLDSNNNNNNDAAFLIGRHGGGNGTMVNTGLFRVREDGLIQANGTEIVYPLPGMYMGASSITDEYLVLMRKYPGTATNATGLLGKIVFQRGGTSAGNDLAEYEINMQTAYTNTAFWKFKRTGANVYTRIDEITIDGVSYYALRARSSGGGASLAHYFEGKILNGASDSLLLTRVRESDANVTLVSAGVYYPDYETLSSNYVQGSLAIGTTAHTKKFHVADSANEVALFEGTGNSAWIDIKGAASELWSIGATSTGYGIYNRTDSSYRFNIDNDGNVGINNTSPTAKLDVDLNSSNSYDPATLTSAIVAVANRNSSNVNNQAAGLHLYATGWAGSTTGVISLNAVQIGGNASTADFTIQTRNAGTYAEKLRLTAAGNLQLHNYGAGFLQTDANGNVTAGAVTTSDTLDDVTDNGNSTTNSIILGDSTTNGTMLVRGSYASGNIVVIGGMKSSGGAMIGYAVKPDTANNHGFVSSSAYTLERAAYYQQGNRHRWYAGASQNAAIGNAVTISETMRLDFDKLGLSTSSPASLIHLGKPTNGANIITFGEAGIGGPHGLDFYGDDATRTKKFSIYYRTGTENISMETSDGTKRFEINQSGAVTLNEAFTFPTADGGAGSALITNGSGALSWNAGYKQYSPVGWTVLNNQTYTSTGANISSSSTQAQAGTTPVQRNSATEFEATKQGWYEISYSFLVKNNYTNRAMIGAYMTVSTSGGGGVVSGSHSTQYVRYNTYGEYAQIQNTFYYYTAYASTNFYLLAYLLSGSMNMTTQSINQSMISFRYINNDIT